MSQNGKWVIAVLVLATLTATGCGVVTGRRSFSNGADQTTSETPSAGTEIGTSSGDVASAQVDPCTLNLDNPVWRDHGGRPAYEKRCGHPPPP